MNRDPNLVLVINQTKMTQPVNVILASGHRDTFFLGPHSRVNLGPGDKICADWQSRNPGIIRVVEPKVTQAQQELPGLLEEKVEQAAPAQGE